MSIRQLSLLGVLLLATTAAPVAAQDEPGGGGRAGARVLPGYAERALPVHPALLVGGDAAQRSIIAGVSIEDLEGNWNHYHFESFAFEAIDPAAFVFTPPAGSRELAR